MQLRNTFKIWHISNQKYFYILSQKREVKTRYAVIVKCEQNFEDVRNIKEYKIPHL